ncbi:MAG: hypothetical protein VKK43_01935 [Synechococcaceae cyanobacterium]|nr:hypothetical protein [Synechococcaceae cyanobacterium]
MLLQLPTRFVLASALAAWCGSAGWSLPAQASPAAVLLIRHGHKDGNPANFNLSRQGLERSMALAGLIPTCFGKVSRIVSYAFSPDTGKNARTYQSAVALALATGVNIRVDSDSATDSRQAGQRILADPASRAGLVVAFWENRRLPLLASGLGWAAMPAMADDDFDALHLLRYDTGSRVPSVLRFSQSQLLEGRQRCPLKPPAANAPVR